MPVEQVSMRTSPDFDRHMLSVGRLCIVWSYLDRLLNRLIQGFIGCTDAQAAIIGTTADSAAGRCKMLLNLVAEQSPDKEWRDAFAEEINRIMNDEGPRRNRYVHDYWTLENGALERMDRRAFVKSAKAREVPELIFDTRHAGKTEDVDNLGAALAITIFCLEGAGKDLAAWKSDGQLPQPSLLKLSRVARPPRPIGLQSHGPEHRG